MDNIQKFRTIIPAERSELIFRSLIEKQDNGEILTEKQFREELERLINEVNARGQITFEIPIKPGELMSSQKMADFFKMLKMDIDVLFVEVDHTEELLNRQIDVINAQLQSLKFAMGRLKAEGIHKKIRVKPGAGFTLIQRDSFDRGYSDLAGRAEVPYDIFQDVRTAEDLARAEAIPIKSDARIEGIGKKLVLPEVDNNNIGFKEININWDETTSKQLETEDIYPLTNIIDGQDDTFWATTIGRHYPSMGNNIVEVSRVQGISGLNPTVNLSGLIDTRSQDYYLRVVGFSGIYPEVVALPTAESYVGPICRYDTGSHCQWHYDQLYSQNCINQNCSRYEIENKLVASGFISLQDGFGYDTGILVGWTNFSGLQAGTTFRFAVRSSGTVGAQISFELDLTTPSNINWFELDPVVDAPFIITALEYSKPNQTDIIPIISGTISVQDRIRLDFPKIEAEKIYITLNQSTYRNSELTINPKTLALNNIEKIKLAPSEPLPADSESVDLQIVLQDYVRNPDLLDLFVQQDYSPTKINGYFYQFGLFEINCGLSTYSEHAIAVSKENRVRTPTMFGIQANLEDGIGLNVSGNNVGTFEFSLVKLNYDSQGSLINIQDFPLPDITDGIITERLFIDADKLGALRFAASAIDSIQDLANHRTLASDEYVLQTTAGTVPRSSVKISRNDVGPSNVLIIRYTPIFGVFLDDNKTLVLENNDSFQLSISDVEAIVTSAAEIANRKIDFSDIFTRIILRRNDHDSFYTPQLRDYQLLINEQDPNRFFV